MADRPTAVLAMGLDVARAVFPPVLRERLRRCVDLADEPLTGSLTGTEAGAVLADTQLLITGWGCPPLATDVLALAPRLQAIVHSAGSVKSLVTEAVWERGLLVSSAADANAGPVVDYTVAVITLASKRALSTAARYGEGWPAFSEREGADGRTVGIIGASRIGRGVLARLSASDSDYQLLLTDPYVTGREAASLGAELVPLDELCRRSSVVSIHAPQLPETHHLMDAAMLALVPDGATVVNTARGSLLDTDALTRECASGRLDAFLDVTDPEPLPAGHPLLTLPNVLTTPHLAGAQGSEVRRLGVYAVEEAERFARGQPLRGGLERADLTRLA
ncbi:hydroxyacid dehydrogenase [Streptomyces sp. NBC_01724]|uniref:hydroxyacid dehydrogenase n=2 Tax=unclassified Streptomyces TaxID=2593676 RepID=UPI0028C4A417|nr:MULTISPECIES: hydroxyacid dehydrogenase [unclassified Streptomyces]WNO63467.1 hydroxyacid dehydrogenase [Streptomyces sp. AM2-3-1]WSC68045.1 hydroxyacid dehydrogenase [Streptomyces sp. NBC_01760]WTI85952.1 hydroxyacid dehydrogenase [Streptomyces sp. NBC_00724]